MKATRGLGQGGEGKVGSVARLGSELGREVARQVKVRQGEAIPELCAFFGAARLGQMTVSQTDTMVAELKGCYDCDPSKVGRPLGDCVFKTSLLEAAFSDLMGIPIVARETECCKEKGTRCVFQLRRGPPLRVR